VRSVREPYSTSWIGHHGALSDEEQLVPLIVTGGGYMSPMPYVGNDERPSMKNFQKDVTTGSLTMNDDRKQEALDAWYQLLKEPEIRMDAEEQYDELLKAADEMERTGLINSAEWRRLVREAGGAFANAIEGLGRGT
jgi:hypothetical protein